MKYRDIFMLFIGFLVGAVLTGGVLWHEKEKHSNSYEQTRTKEQVEQPQATCEGSHIQDEDKKNQLSQKLMVLQAKLAVSPNDYQTLVEIANIYFDLENFTEASEHYQKALAISENDPNIITDFGITLKKLGKFDEAGVEFAKAQKRDSSHWKSLYHLITIKTIQGEQAKAIEEDYRRMLTLTNNNPKIPYTMAAEFYEAGKFQYAIIYFRKTLEIAPKDWMCQYYLACSYEQDQQIEQAIAAYEKTKAMLPQGHDISKLDQKIHELKAMVPPK